MCGVGVVAVAVLLLTPSVVGEQVCRVGAVLLLLASSVGGEQVCKLRSVFGHVVEYRCPEYGAAALRHCCGPYSAEGRCCAEENPRLEEEEERMVKEGGARVGEELASLLTYLGTAAGLVVAVGCCCLCLCRCCPCCWLARRREREREQEEQLPLDTLGEEVGGLGAYPAPPWPPQHTVPQQWAPPPAYNPHIAPYTDQPPDYPMGPQQPPSHLQQPPANPQHTPGYPQHPPGHPQPPHHTPALAYPPLYS